MSPEQLEFILTQYLDGTLPAGEVVALEEALERDPKARALREEHEKLTALLRSQRLPEMDWEELSRDLSAVVTGTVDEESRVADERLNVVIQSAIPLPALQWDELAKRISGAVDAERDRVDAEDEKIEAMMRALPMPAVNWDRLAGQISKAVAAESGVTEEVERPAVAGRIGWVRTASRLAMAACLLLAAGVGIRVYMTKPATNVVHPTGQGALVMVETPKVEVSNQPAIAEISIGPSKEYVANSDQEFYPQGVASRSAVVIASPVVSDDDGDRPMGLGFD
jgi:negative regulator of sigma E activity